MQTGTTERLGRRVLDFFSSVYELFLLFINTLRSLSQIWFYRRQVAEQLYIFSARTLPIAVIIAVFIGLGTMVQGIYQSSHLVPRYITINVIYKSTLVEVCPIVLALVLAGKLGASLAAEIGSMKISEQLEALETLSLDPVGFLVMPRVLAGLIMLPVITIFANFIALFAVFFVASVAGSWVSPAEFMQGLKVDYRGFELYFGNIIKPGVFGFFIALIGSYYGTRTHGGALGVGRSSTNAVVVSAILIVFFDYFFGKLLL